MPLRGWVRLLVIDGDPTSPVSLLSFSLSLVIQHHHCVVLWITSRYLWWFNITRVSAFLLVISGGSTSSLCLALDYFSLSMVIQHHSHISVFRAPITCRRPNTSPAFGSCWLVLAVIIQHVSIASNGLV
jgi:hypothetical protein